MTAQDKPERQPCCKNCPMAEFVMKDMVKKQGLAEQFYIASAATSTEEIGNPVHYGVRNKLAQLGISTAGKYAVRMERRDYQKYDYIVGMDNLLDDLRIIRPLFYIMHCILPNIIYFIIRYRTHYLSRISDYQGTIRDYGILRN